MEDRMDISQKWKLELELPFDPVIPHLGIYPILMTLLTIPKFGNKLSAHQQWMDKDVVYKHKI